MNRKQKMLLAIAIIITLITLLAIGYFFMNSNNKGGDLSGDVNMKEEGNQTKPTADTDLSVMDFDVVEYTVYNLEDIDFGFIIAKIRVQSKKDSINVDLSHFKTSEGVDLSIVDNYVKELEKNNYYLGKQNVWFEIVSTDNEYMGNIFIPYKDKSLKELDVKIDLNENDLFKFNLSNKKGTKDMLYYEGDDVITDGKTYQMKVSQAFEITGDSLTRTYPDGFSEDYLYPATAEVYAFKIEAVSLWGDEVQIESAIYEVEGSGDVFDAMDSKITSMKYDNIVGDIIKDKGNGVLLFMTLNPDREPIKYKGRLKIKLVGKDEWLTIRVDL